MNTTTQQLAKIILARVPRKPGGGGGGGGGEEEELPTTVEGWLARSKAAHLDYRKAHDDRQHIPAEAALQKAALARAEAEQLDPEHRDIAWQDEGGTHAAGQASHEDFNEPLLRFYTKKLDLGRPGDPLIPPER